MLPSVPTNAILYPGLSHATLLTSFAIVQSSASNGGSAGPLRREAADRIGLAWAFNRMLFEWPV